MGGIIGTAYRWFESYLMIRKQFVFCKGLESDTMGLNYGVPEGSALGPSPSIMMVCNICRTNPLYAL